jgi:hypothetical protein
MIDDKGPARMADFITRYERQLVTVRRPRLLVPRRARIAAIAVVALLTGTAVAAVVPWTPDLGPGHARTFAIDATKPPQAQLDALGVLRRPQSDADRGAETRYALRFFGASVGGVRTDYVRLLRRDPNGRSAVLVPVTAYHLNQPDSLPDAARKLLAPGRDGLCLFVRDPIDGGGQSCSPLADLRAGNVRGGIADRTSSLWWGLVPDEVTSVRIRMAERDLVAAAVEDNYYSFTLPQREEGVTISSLDWLDGAGHVIKMFRGWSVSPPSRAPGRGGCANQPTPGTTHGRDEACQGSGGAMR